MIEFDPMGEKQEAGKLMVLAQLYHVAIEMGYDLVQVHERVFPLLMGCIYPGVENTM